MGGILAELLPAVYVTATGNSDFKTAMTGGIFQEIAETADGTPMSTYPYAVINEVSELPGYTFNTEDSETLIQISIFDIASSPATMWTNIQKLHIAFDNITLTISNWTSVRVERVGHVLLAKDENKVRHSATTYNFRMFKD